MAPPDTELRLPRYVTGFGSLETDKNRFILISQIRQAAGWDKPESEERILVEHVSQGHLRIHRYSKIAAELADQEKQIQDRYPNARDREVAFQILRDRFQEGRYLPKDNHRVELREESLHSFLGAGEDWPKSIKIFLQLGETAIDVMTLGSRAARLNPP